MRLPSPIRVLLYIVAGLLVLGIAGVILLHTPPARRAALTRVQEALASQGVNLQLEDLNYNLLSFRIRVGRFSIHAVNAPDLPTFLSADGAEVHLSLLDLIRGAYNIREATIANPRIHVVIAGDGRSNIPSSTQSRTGSTQWFVRQLTAANTSIVFEHRPSDTGLTLPSVDVDLRGNILTGSHNVQLKTRQDGQFRYGRSAVSFGTQSTISLPSDHSSLAIEEARIVNAGTALDVSGEIMNLSQPVLDLAVAGPVELTVLRDFFPQDHPRLEGVVQLESNIDGPVDALVIDGELAGNQLAVERLENVMLDAGFNFNVAAKRIDLRSAAVRSPLLTASAEGSIFLQPEAGETRLSARITDANLVALSRTVQAPVTLSGKARGVVDLRWPGLQMDRVRGNGRVELSGVDSSNPRYLPVDGVIQLSSTPGSISFATENLSTGSTHVAGSVSIAASDRIQGQFAVRTNDSGETLRRVVGLSGKEMPEGLRISGPVDGTISLSGTIRQPSISAHLSGQSIDVNQLRQVLFVADAAYTKDRLDLQNVTATWRGHSVNASGNILFRDQEQALQLRVDVPTGTVEQALAAAGRSDIPASGTFQAAAEITGTVQKPQGTVVLNAANLYAYGEMLGELTARGRFEHPTVFLDELTLAKGVGTLTAAGTYDIPGKTHMLTAEGRNLSIVSLILPGQTDPLTAQLTFSGTSSGLVTNPTASLKATAVDVRFQGNVLESAELEGTLDNHQAQLQARVDTDLGGLASVRDQQLGGRVSTVVSASGDVRDPEQGYLRADVMSLDFIWRNRRISGANSFTLEYKGRVLTVSDTSLQMDGSHVNFSGSLPLDRTASGEIQFEAFGDLASIALILPINVPITMEGEATISGVLRGNLRQLDPEATIQISEVYIETPALPAPIINLNAVGRVQGGQVTIKELSTQWAVANIRAEGSVPLGMLLPDGLPLEVPNSSGSARVTADVDALRITTLPGLPDAADGLVSAHAEITAPRMDLDAVEGTIQLPILNVRVREYEVMQVSPTLITLRNGVASIDDLRLEGPRTNIDITGSAALSAAGPIDLTVDGNADAAIVSFFSEDVSALGDIAMQLRMRGTRQAPQMNGFVEVISATAGLETPELAVEGLDVRLDLQGSDIVVTYLEGLLNGGDISGSGSFSIAEGTRGAGKAQFQLNGTYLEFPEGLRTLSSSNLSVTSSAGRYRIGGDVNVINGSYTETFAIERGLLQFVSTGDTPALGLERESPLLARIELDVAVQTSSPVIIENDTARANITANLEVKGTAAQPGLTGQILVEEGAELRLRERRYEIERGIVRFTNEQAIEPILDIEANTRVTTSTATYDITMQITGNVAERIETNFTATGGPPILSEGDIVSVLATGRTLAELGDSGVAVAQEQVLSYVAGAIGEGLSQGVGRATGLSQVRIEPALIANEANPTARLTLGQDLTPELSLVYSMDLLNSNDQIWIGRYTASRRFTMEALRQADASFRFQFQHDLLFGGLPDPARSDARVNPMEVRAVTFTGNEYFTTEQLQKAFRLKPGDLYDFFRVRDGIERIEKLFREENYFEARVFFDRVEQGMNVDLNLRVREGSRIEFVYDGWSPPKDVQEEIIEEWQRGTLDVQRLREATSLLRDELFKGGYLAPSVEATTEAPAEGVKRFTFSIDQGLRYSQPEIVFEGVDTFDQAQLLAMLEAEGFLERDVNEMEAAVPHLRRALIENGYFDVIVEAPRVSLSPEGGTAQVAFRITEGQRYRYGAVQFTGNKAFDEDLLRQQTSTEPGLPYLFAQLRESQSSLLKLYRNAGFDEVDVDFAQVRVEGKPVVDITFTIVEGQARILADLDIQGNDQTSVNLVRTQLGMPTGTPVSAVALSRARNNLYATGAYSLVDIDVEALPADYPMPEGLDPTTQRPVRLVITVREVQPYQFRYGGFYDTERGPGGVVDFFIRNKFGSARVLGLHGRYDRDVRQARIHISQPTLLRFPVKSTAAAFFAREQIGAELVSPTGQISSAEGRITNRRGFTIQMEHRFRENYVANIGYRIERTRTFTEVPDLLAPEENLRVAPLTASLTRDTRDNPLDATRGLFTSHSAEWATARLGSQSRYAKYFGQYFQYFPLGEPSFVPWSREIRHRFVLAGGVRLGVGKGLGGGSLPASERFFAGGATTVRGFEQNFLGPVTDVMTSEGLTRQPVGGDAMFVGNAEIRFPVYSFVDGVAFVDAGNVFPHSRDLRFSDVRYTSGIGLRLRTPYVLIRFDYGVKLDRLPGEGLGKLFFSIGQAF